MRPLWSVAARDRDDDVRTSAVASLASFGRVDVAFPFVKALWSEHPSIVANAAAALGQLGDAHAVVWLVTRLVSHGSSPGANFSQLSQQAYVQDFDVEVAQTSFIADPVIGTVQEGVVQDVKVLDLTIERTFVEMRLVQTIARLAKADLKSPAEVASWWKEHQPSIPRLARGHGRERGRTEVAPPPVARRRCAGTPSTARDARPGIPRSSLPRVWSIGSARGAHCADGPSTAVRTMRHPRRWMAMPDPPP